MRAAAHGTDTDVEAYNLIARMLLGEEPWQQYSQMLRGIMNRRQDREKEEKEKTRTRGVNMN